MTFSDGGEGEVVYRPISRFAVFALLLGILSALALISPLMWVVPLVAIGIAVTALRITSSRSKEVAGRSLALAGLILAMLFGTWAPTRQFSRDWMLRSRSQQFSQHWLDLVRQNRLEEAHQLHLPHRSRLPDNASLKSYYSLEGTPQKDFIEFFNSPALQKLISAGEQVKVKLRESDLFRNETDMKSDSVNLRYQLLWEENGEQKSLFFTVTMARTSQLDSGQTHWHVKGIQENTH